MNQVLQIIVSGKVQGVWFRKNTKIVADKEGIKGTVQNLQNGTVKIIASAGQKALENFLAWAKEGPIHAEVVSISVDEIDTNQKFSDFQIIR